MKIKKLWIIPIILIIISVISSIVAFNQTRLLNLGYLYVDGETKTTTYSGEYVAIIGNTLEVDKIEILLLDEYVELITYDMDDFVLDKYHLTVSYDYEAHHPELVSSTVENQKLLIDEMDEYLFVLDLEEDQSYDFQLDVIESDPYTDDIDLVFANIPEHVLNLKSLMEGVAFSTLIFTVISTITIAAIIFIRKNR